MSEDPGVPAALPPSGPPSTWRTLWFGPVMVLCTVFFSLVSVVGGLLRAPAALHDWVQRNWARGVLAAAGVRVQVSGLERLPGAPQILVCNHQSMFDVWALLAVMPASVRFVAKRELGRIPVLAAAMRAAGHVFIDRDDRRGAAARMRAAGRRMARDGLSLGLFPEGTRSADGHLGRFKKGAFVLAIETQCPLVPVALDGGYRLAEGWRVRPGGLRLRVGTPVATAGRPVEDRDEVLEAVRRQIASMLRELRWEERGGGR